MTKRTCCFIEPAGGPKCAKPAEWEIWPSTAVYEFTDGCTDHVGHLLDDAPETRVIPLKQ